MTDQNRESNQDLKPQSPEGQPANELDAAGKSLFEALRISFVILKIIMVVLVGLFLLLGFKTVKPGELALVLRFGKIRGLGEDRLLKPGPHWVLPYPIEEIIRIPTERKVDLPIDSFWYYQTKEEILSGKKRQVRPDEPLRPIHDGYCITRSEKQSQTTSDSTGSDYNIVHCKWLLTYQIDKPEVFNTRNIICASEAVSLSGFISCISFMVFNPSGVAALSRPNIFAEKFIIIEAVAG